MMAMKPLTVPAVGGFPFDGEFLRKVERLELVARKMFRGLVRGEHAARRRGHGLEFADFRGYRPGDDFRHIDWNIYSRLDQLFLKLHAAEEDVTLHLLVDASASMGFGEPSKFDHARKLAAAQGRALSAQQATKDFPRQELEPLQLVQELVVEDRIAAGNKSVERLHRRGLRWLRRALCLARWAFRG